MALPQRDHLIDAIQNTDLLLEYAVMHGDEAEAERLRKRRWEIVMLGDRTDGGREEDCA